MHHRRPERESEQYASVSSLRESSAACIRRVEDEMAGLNSSYAPDRFIGDLDHALMRLADPKDIVAVTVRMLGQYTGVDRCDYAEVEADQDHFVILGDYTRGATNTITGRYRMSDFGGVCWKTTPTSSMISRPNRRREPTFLHICVRKSGLWCACR